MPGPAVVINFAAPESTARLPPVDPLPDGLPELLLDVLLPLLQAENKILSEIPKQQSAIAQKSDFLDIRCCF